MLELGRAGHRADMLGGFLAMTDIRLTQGRLADAQRTVERERLLVDPLAAADRDVAGQGVRDGQRLGQRGQAGLEAVEVVVEPVRTWSS